MSSLRQFEVGVVYRFWAESAEHAVEQFTDAEPYAASAVNFVTEVVDGESDEHA